MKVTDIILSGIAGTTAFTLFSYLISEKTGQNFKQPEMLGKLIKRSDIELKESQSQFTGWMMHYLIGISLAAVYKILVEKTGMKPTVKNGILAGAATSIPAVLSWHTTLDMHPAPPRGKSLLYYTELFFGHVIFGATCFFVFKKRNGKARDILQGDLTPAPALSVLKADDKKK